MAKIYYVVGGEYSDTTFQTIATGKTEERFGPFDEHEAHICWRALTGKSVDNAMVRYFIRLGQELGEGTGEEQWFVVGGEYSDTTFQTIAPGKDTQVHGPYTRKEATAKWRELTGRTVDSALTRFDLFTLDEVTRRGLK